MRSTSKLFAALRQDAVSSALRNLPGWSAATLSSGKEVIQKKYEFKDFRTAWAFMESLVPFINETDHHPEWENVYNRVQVTLTTHDVGNKVSDKDVALASKMEEAAAKASTR